MKTLVIMAAGMGSRYGGLKQIDPITPQGEIIMDFSVFDAVKAGFNKVVIVIKKENEPIFKQLISRFSKDIKCSLAYQDIKDIPKEFKFPEGRVKPWGTGHALLSAADEIEGDFAVINADDFYGRDSFIKISEFFDSSTDANEYCMAGYRLVNTLSENGSVSRGVCNTEKGYLLSIDERTDLCKNGDKIYYGGVNEVSGDSVVSLNCFGFKKSFLEPLYTGFKNFLNDNIDNLKAEYYLPALVSELINNNSASVKVLKTDSKWYGVTYKEDKESVSKSLSDMKKKGEYPLKLWE